MRAVAGLEAATVERFIEVFERIPFAYTKTPQAFLAREKKAEAVVSVSPTSAHPYWTRTIEPDGTLRKFTPDEEGWVRRQDLPQAYMLNGAIFLASHELLVSRRTFYTDRTLAFVMPEERSLDVDTPFDLTLVDLLLSRTG